MCTHEKYQISLDGRLVIVRCSSCPIIIRYDEIDPDGKRIVGINLNRVYELKENRP